MSKLITLSPVRKQQNSPFTQSPFSRGLPPATLQLHKKRRLKHKKSFVKMILRIFKLLNILSILLSSVVADFDSKSRHPLAVKTRRKKPQNPLTFRHRLRLFIFPSLFLFLSSFPLRPERSIRNRRQQ
jgi:hypothetical protein